MSLNYGLISNSVFVVGLFSEFLFVLHQAVAAGFHRGLQPRGGDECDLWLFSEGQQVSAAES